jgi:Na+-driven multidrug efflux pump
VITLAVFLPAAALVLVLHGGLVALWLAYSLWLLARFVTLILRGRSSKWLVTGAAQR